MRPHLPPMKISRRIFKYTQFQKSCSNPKNVSRKSIESYHHLKSVAEKLHLSGGTVDLLIGTDFVDFVETASSSPGEPVAERNCFGWYILGQVDPDSKDESEIKSVDVATANAVEDIKKLVHRDFFGVRSTQLCTCSENTLHENEFVKVSQPRLQWWMEEYKSKCRGKKLDSRSEVIMTLL